MTFFIKHKLYSHEIFAISTALGSTQFPIQWETRFYFPGRKVSGV
jgi:hypothetical protein